MFRRLLRIVAVLATAVSVAWGGGLVVPSGAEAGFAKKRFSLKGHGPKSNGGATQGSRGSGRRGSTGGSKSGSTSGINRGAKSGGSAKAGGSAKSGGGSRGAAGSRRGR